jgi:hypothetical protein
LDGFQGATANRCVFQSILFEWGCFRMALTQRERHNTNAKRRKPGESISQEAGPVSKTGGT